MPHFGVVLHLPDWQVLAARLTGADATFDLAPAVRFQGQPGNPIEIKGFPDLAGVFAH